MKQYKAILMDWDDTIGDWKGAERKALEQLHRMYRLDVLYPTPEDFIAAYKPFNLELWTLYGKGEISKPDLQFSRFMHPIENMPMPQEQLTQMAHEMGREFLRLTNVYFTLLPGAAETVRALAARYPLTIISNGFKEVQYYKFSHSGLADCFRHIFISEEVGINKPQPEIFRIALERNGVHADEAVMIGDSYTSDIAGAKAAGIDQIWLHEGPTDETATYIIPQLTEVTDLL